MLADRINLLNQKAWSEVGSLTLFNISVSAVFVGYRCMCTRTVREL